MNQTNWMYFVHNYFQRGGRIYFLFDSLLLLLMLTKNKQMWSTSLIGWYVEWSTYFLLNLSSLRMVLMMITDDEYFTNDLLF